MRVDLISGTDAFTILAPDWDRVVRGAMTDTPFQTLAYQRGWWQHLRPEGATLHTLCLRAANGTPVAIACLYLHEGVLYFNGCVEESDYLDLIGAEEVAEMAWRSVFPCLNGMATPDWTGMELCNVPEASPTRQILPLLAQEYGLEYSESVYEVCPVISLPATHDDYLMMLDRKQRHELRRKLRRADAAKLSVRQANGTNELPAAVDHFLELLQKSSPQKKEWLHSGRRALFHEIARAAAEAGTLQLLFIEKDGRAAAALYNFDYNGRVWVYNSGLDPAAFGHLSPGVVLTARAIEMAIVGGRKEFDFLRGNEVYKYRFGAQDTKVYRLIVNRKP